MRREVVRKWEEPRATLRRSFVGGLAALVSVAAGRAGEGIKKAGALIWPTALVRPEGGHAACGLARDGHRSPVRECAVGRNASGEERLHRHSEPPPRELFRARDMRARRESTRAAEGMSTRAGRYGPPSPRPARRPPVPRRLSNVHEVSVRQPRGPCADLSRLGAEDSCVDSGQLVSSRDEPARNTSPTLTSWSYGKNRPNWVPRTGHDRGPAARGP